MKKCVFISVYNRKLIVELADALRGLGYDIFSTGATYKLLHRSDVKSAQIKNVMLNSVLNSILGLPGALPTQPHIVVADLYPLEKITGQDNFSVEELPEYLDPFNITILRTAASKFRNIIALCDSRDYDFVYKKIAEKGDVSAETKKKLAAKVYNYCAYYDAAVSNYLAGKNNLLELENAVLPLTKMADVQGEDKNQKCFFYKLTQIPPTGMSAIKIIQGKSFTYNHYMDINYALELISGFENGCLALRHMHIQSLAFGRSPVENFSSVADRGIEGCIIAFNEKVDLETSGILSKSKVEAVLAPEYSGEALNLLKMKKRLKLIVFKPLLGIPNDVEIHSVCGGVLARGIEHEQEKFRSANTRKPSPFEMNLLKKAWHIVKFAKSYSAVFLNNFRILSIADGQGDSADSVLQAVEKLRKNHPILAANEMLVFASDMPLTSDLVNEIVKCKVSAIVSPENSSSRENAQCAKVCEEYSLPLVFADRRQFRK